MAFGRLERNARPQPMSDINMTPLIDVMLVLLIIFILTAPLMNSSLKLDLPKAEGGATTEMDGAVVMIALTANGQLHWGEQVISVSDLQTKLKQVAQRNPSQEIQLRADQAVPYGRVAELIGFLQQAGLMRIAFIKDEPRHSQDAAVAHP